MTPPAGSASPRSPSDNKKPLTHRATTLSVRSTATSRSFRSVTAENPPKAPAPIYQQPIIDVSVQQSIDNPPDDDGGALADELDYIAVSPPSPTTSAPSSQLVLPSREKAARVLGIQHRRSMEPIPASNRTSLVSTRSARNPPPVASFTPTLPLTSLYVVSGLPKAPHTWTLADPDSVMGLTHSEGAVSRWWRAEVLGSTISPGAGGGKKKKKGKGEEVHKGAGALSKQEVGKMLSKALKLSFTREVEIIASTLQPASTVHTFSFSLPAPSTPLAPSHSSSGLLRSSVLSTATASDIHRPTSTTGSALGIYPYNDPFSTARPSSAFLGPPGLFPPGPGASGSGPSSGANGSGGDEHGSTVTYHGVCLTVWSHADAERSAAIRRTLEASRSRKESAQSLVAARIKGLRADAMGAGGDPSLQARRSTKRSARGPWGGPNGAVTDGETDMDVDTDGAMSESDFEVASTVNGHNPGESTLFLPGDTVFWLPYALTLVSRHPIYDLMRDYLTLSWARFSKDVQSHTLQISKILSHPAPRAGDLIKLDASASGKSDASGAAGAAAGADTSLEVIARFPGGLDFGRGLVDINFTMWPLFKALNIDNILTICEIALAPTGRILFFSRHPAMLGIAVSTIKYLVELRGWNGIALQAVHSRDAKIYIDDPGPWIIGLATEARYSVRPMQEVCICDLSCPSPPPGVVSTKQQRERYRQRLLSAFEPHYHPDHSVPSEFKEAFPAGRFRPVCKIQAKRGGSSAAVADTIKPPEWWHSTRIIQAFDAVLQDRFKKPSLLKRISSLGAVKRPPQLTVAEQHIQHSIRKRATAFVDARDDLETKIGRLSRRLNFLMTESDLWRDKFVTFEQYAEKLSIEANELRSKINKEQRETRRLSGLVTSTAVEKTKLQSQLRDTEMAHKEAIVELQNMRITMETMEQERAAMVAEVEEQIEKALASMAVGMAGDSEFDESRPASRISSRSRGASDASRVKQLRSYGTESTLAESYDGQVQDEAAAAAAAKTDLAKEAVIEEEEDEDKPLSPHRKKRFSNSQTEQQQDGMTAVDEGISERSDRIARKVLQIQKKLENALAADGNDSGWKSSSPGSESELSDMRQSASVRPRPPKGTKLIGKPPRSRVRSGTASSGRQTPQLAHASSPSEEGSKAEHAHSRPSTAHQATPRGSVSGRRTPTTTPTTAAAVVAAGEIPDEQLSDKEQMPRTSRELRKIPSSVSLSATRPASPALRTPTTPALTPAMTGTTDDSDTDFQSAYSMSMSPSPRDSYRSAHMHGAGAGNGHGSRVVSESDGSASEVEDFGKELPARATTAPSAFIKGRERVSSVATTIGSSDAQPSPTLSEDTVVSQARAAKRSASAAARPQ
ncbi:hypothetical protein DENSPDRAFT_850258 [Dentipellis sp. KUC8613]|nr:hypothetical protein DENSPDRAFT_850258 [Dentipellis sp. KUC8613]